MKKTLPLLILAGSLVAAHGQSFYTSPTTEQFLSGLFSGQAGREHSQWDLFYSAHTGLNYPDVAAPYGIRQTAQAAGFTVTNAAPTYANPFAYFHVDNPTLRQTVATGSAMIIGPGVAGSSNIYSLGDPLAFEVSDTVSTGVGTVNFQWGTEGQFMDASSLRLVYNNGSQDITLTPTNFIQEYRASDQSFGFGLFNRISAQWDLTGLGITSYKLLFEAPLPHASFQEAALTTAPVYEIATPAASTFDGGAGDGLWSSAANWAGDQPTSQGGNVTFLEAGTALTLDLDRTVAELAFKGSHDFALSGSSTLKVNAGITVAPTTLGTPATVTISTPLTFGSFNLLNVASGSTLRLTGPVGTPAGLPSGFYKEGEGTVEMLGNNTWEGRFVSNAGTTVLGGSNQFTGTVLMEGGTLRLLTSTALNLNAVGFSAVATAAKVQLWGTNVAFGGLTGTPDAGYAPQGMVVENGHAVDAYVQVNHTANYTFGGVLRDGGKGTLALWKLGSGTLLLNGPNTYTGATVVGFGNLSLSSNRALPAVGGGLTGHVTLETGGLLGFAETGTLGADRHVWLGGASNVNIGGFKPEKGAVMTVAGSVSLRPGGVADTGILYKAGNGVLDLQGSVDLGPGGWIQHMQGVLIVNGNTAPYVVNGGTLRWAPGVTTDVSIAPAGYQRDGLTIEGTGATFDTNGQNVVFGSSIIGSAPVVKNGAGMLTLTGAINAGSTTRVNGGTLRLNLTTSGTAPTVGALTLGGGTLEVVGNGTGARTLNFGALNAVQGSSRLQATANGHAVNLNFTNVTGVSASFVDFVTPALGNINLSGTGVFTLNGVLTRPSGTTNTNNVFGTVNGTNWASLVSGNVVALTTYETSTNSTDWALTENVAPTGNATVSADRAINTLKLNGGNDVAVANGTVLGLATGGILVTGSGASEISGGTLTGASTGSAREIVVVQNNTADAFTISSIIANNAGATALVKVGPGTLRLTGANTFTGAIRIVEGTLEVNNVAAGAANPLGLGNTGSTFFVIDGGTFRYTGPAATTNRNFQVGSRGATIDASGTGALFFSSQSGITYNSGTSPTLVLTGSNTGNNTLSNQLTNETGSNTGVTSLIKRGSGTWVLGFADQSSSTLENSFTGGVEIEGGTLRMGFAGALHTTLNPTGYNAVNFASGVAAGTRLQLNGFSPIINTLHTRGSGASNAVVENSGTAASTLTIVGGADSRFAGTLQNGGTGTLSLAKSGLGRMELVGAQSYTGTTAVHGGSLVVSGSLTGTASVSVATSGRLQVDGAIQANAPISVASHGVLTGDGTVGAISLGPDAILTAGDLDVAADFARLDATSLTWNGGSTIELELGATTLQLDQIGLSGAFTKGSGTGFAFNLLNEGAVLGQTYELLQFSSTTFTAADLSLVWYSELWGFLTVDSDSVNFTVTAIPEPSTFGLLAMSAGSWLGFRRRRKSLSK